MAKQHQAARTRPGRARASHTPTRKAPRLPSSGARRPTRVASARSAAAPAQAPATPAPPPRKPAYYEAIAAYETGVRALQRHDFSTAAAHFRQVIDRHPEERELVERASLYLRVCERETERRPAGPRTPRERIYAATVALNAGDAQAALGQLRQALAEDPTDDHGHYILAVALSERRQLDDAVGALRRAIELNDENRSVARNDPDLAALRDLESCRSLLLEHPEPVKRRSRR